MTRKILLFTLLLVGFGRLAQSQVITAENDPRRYIDTAVVLMDQEKYAQADGYFLRALNEIELLSADFCYFFGKNSFYLEKYKQSIDWLNKYLELKGSRGQYSQEVIALSEKAEEGYKQNRESVAEAAGVSVSTKFFYQNTIRCDESTHLTCPICRGDDVIITLDKFGERIYKTCPYSTNGILTCEEFNLLIQGKLKPKSK